jgi:predicted GIY-YIG superfamily endonuclease
MQSYLLSNKRKKTLIGTTQDVDVRNTELSHHPGVKIAVLLGSAALNLCVVVTFLNRSRKITASSDL